MQSILQRVGGSKNKRRESCRLRRHRHRHKIGNATVGRQEVGILGILHGLTIRELFLRVRTSFGWRRGKLPDNRRGVWRELPLARHICARKAHQRKQCTSTVARDANTRGSSPTRLKANTAQDGASW